MKYYFFAIAIVILCSCNNYGKRVKINDNLTVFYKGEGVTESDAKKLGAFFESAGWGKDGAATVQLSKDSNTYVLRLPAKDEVYKANRERFRLAFWLTQDEVSEAVFNGSPTRVVLTDDRLRDVDPMDAITRIEPAKGHIFYLKGRSLKPSRARELADSLEAAKFFNITNGNVFFSKDDLGYALRFQPAIGVEDKSLDESISDYRYLISKYILNTDDIDLIVVAPDFSDVKKAKQATNERKAYFDYMIKYDETKTKN